jgi:hypothetical protein
MEVVCPKSRGQKSEAREEFPNDGMIIYSSNTSSNTRNQRLVTHIRKTCSLFCAQPPPPTPPFCPSQNTPSFPPIFFFAPPLVEGYCQRFARGSQGLQGKKETSEEMQTDSRVQRTKTFAGERGRLRVEREREKEIKRSTPCTSRPTRPDPPHPLP